MSDSTPDTKTQNTEPEKQGDDGSADGYISDDIRAGYVGEASPGAG